MKRFDYVIYDPLAVEAQAQFKEAFINLETMVETLRHGRAKALVLAKLEEAYMWVGKAIRDEQILRDTAVLQEERTNI